MCSKLDILMEQNFWTYKAPAVKIPAEYINKLFMIVKFLPSNLAKLELQTDFLEQACIEAS